MKKTQSESATADVLKDLLIVQLGLARVNGEAIRSIARCDMNRVTKILKALKAGAKRARSD